MTKEELKNNQKVWVYSGSKSIMVGRVNKTSNGYITITDLKGFVHSISLLSFQYSELNFKIYEKI